jgi:hypothetical protein
MDTRTQEQPWLMIMKKKQPGIKQKSQNKVTISVYSSATKASKVTTIHTYIPTVQEKNKFGTEKINFMTQSS